MTRRNFGLGMASLLVAAMMLSGCAKRLQPYRYRLTVAVNTPEGVKTGSSVIEIQLYDQGSGWPVGGQASGIRARVIGEAVMVDLGKLGLLFALLRSEDNVDWAVSAFGGYLPRLYDRDGNDRGPKLYDQQHGSLGEKHVLPRYRIKVGAYDKAPSGYPMLVRFSDLFNSKTVEVIDPDNMPDIFGPGVSLKSVTVRLTDGRPTFDIKNRLKWLGQYPEPSLDPGHSPYDYSPAAILHQGDFVRTP